MFSPVTFSVSPETFKHLSLLCRHRTLHWVHQLNSQHTKAQQCHCLQPDRNPQDSEGGAPLTFLNHYFHCTPAASNCRFRARAVSTVCLCIFITCNWLFFVYVFLEIWEVERSLTPKTGAEHTPGKSTSLKPYSLTDRAKAGLNNGLVTKGNARMGMAWVAPSLWLWGYLHTSSIIFGDYTCRHCVFLTVGLLTG